MNSLPGRSMKLSSVQLLRAAAVLAVLAAHMRGFEVSLHIESVFDRLIPAEATGVDLFFVISGFIMMFVHWEDFGARKSLLFLKKRFFRIFPMYWALTALLAGLFAYSPGIAKHWQSMGTGMLESFLLLPQDHMPLLFVGWSLVFEMYFYYVFAALLTTSRKVAGMLFGAWAMALAVMQFFLFPAPAAISLMQSSMTISFLFGVGIAAIAKTRTMRFALPSLAIGLIAYAVIAAIGIQHGEHWIEDSHARYLMAGLPMACVLYAMVALELQGKIRVNAAIVFLGDASYSIYLSHVLSYALFTKLMLSVESHIAVPMPIVLLTGYLFAIVIGGALYRYVERPLTKYLARFTRPAITRLQTVPVIVGEMQTSAPVHAGGS